MAAQHRRCDGSHFLHTSTPVSPDVNGSKCRMVDLDDMEIITEVLMVADPEPETDEPKADEGQADSAKAGSFIDRMEQKYEGFKKEEAAEEEDATEEDPKTRGRQGGRLPSLEAQRQHNKVHLPFRSWCKHCVMARLQHCPHSSHERAPGSTREVHVDYCFFRNGRGQETVPVLV